MNAAELLREELAKPNHRCEPITIGANTDPYQPIEREWKITRQVLEVLTECEHPAAIITKNALVERDLDLLKPMADKNLIQVFVSVTTLDHELARRMEPRASAPRAESRPFDAGTGGRPGWRDDCTCRSVPDRFRARIGAGGCGGGGSVSRRLHADAFAVGVEGSLQGLARAKLSAQSGARYEPRASNAKR